MPRSALLRAAFLAAACACAADASESAGAAALAEKGRSMLHGLLKRAEAATFGQREREEGRYAAAVLDLLTAPDTKASNIEAPKKIIIGEPSPLKSFGGGSMILGESPL